VPYVTGVSASEGQVQVVPAHGDGIYIAVTVTAVEVVTDVCVGPDESKAAFG